MSLVFSGALKEGRARSSSGGSLIEKSNIPNTDQGSMGIVKCEGMTAM